MMCYGADKCSAANFKYMTKMFHIEVKHVGKHNRNIFETFGASLVVFSMASIKSHFTKLSLVAMFLTILSKVNRFL